MVVVHAVDWFNLSAFLVMKTPLCFLQEANRRRRQREKKVLREEIIILCSMLRA